MNLQTIIVWYVALPMIWLFLVSVLLRVVANMMKEIIPHYYQTKLSYQVSVAHQVERPPEKKQYALVE